MRLAPILPEKLHSTPLGHKAHAVALAAREQGGRGLLVGGYVRDCFLGLDPKDADLEVYGIEPAALKTLLNRHGRVGVVGESFRVYKLTWHENGVRHELDVALPRRDKKVGSGHRGFEVEGDPYASVEDAARRRDFTVNAILLDPITGEVLDPYGGREDLQASLLRAVDARHFGEDSLRVLRAVQFAARYNMDLAPDTVKLCRGISLEDLPRERVWGEVEKWLLKAQFPSRGLVVAHQLLVLEKLFPYLMQAYQRSTSAMESALDGGAKLKMDLPAEKQVALMLAVLGTFLGWKGTTLLLDDLNIHKMKGQSQHLDVRRTVIQLVGKRKTAPDWWCRKNVGPADFRMFSVLVEPRLALKLWRARGFEGAADWFEGQLASAGVLEGPPSSLLSGKHLLELGLEPGPAVGAIVRAVYAQQLSGMVSTMDEAMTSARQLLSEIK